MLTFVVWFVATTIASADVADDDFRVASRQFSRKRWAPAATELAAFLNDHPDDPRSADARYLLGESLVQLRRYPEARKHLNQFLRQTDDHRYTRQAEFRAAESAFHAADHVAARTELEAFRQRYPDDALSPYVMAYLGEIALIDRDGQTAVVMFSEVLQRETVSRLDSQCRFGLAQAHELLGNAEEAMRLYGQAVEPASRYSQQAQFRIAMLQYRQAGYDKAELILEHLAATLDGDLLFETQYWLGMSRLRQQNWLAAAQALQEGLEDSPAHRLAPGRRFALAEALRKSGRRDEAKEHYTTVFELDPPADWSDDAGQILVLLAWEGGNLPGVHEMVQRFFDRFPLSSLADDVRQHQGRALLFEQRDGALYQLAWLLLETGDQTQADLRFVQLVKEHQRSPLWVDAMFRLARNAAERNDVTQANYWLDELLFGVARNSTRDHQRPHDTQRDSTTTTTDISRIVCHALYLQGKLAVDAGEWLASLRSYQRIVEEYPQSDLASAASFWSAESQFHLAHYEQADAMLAQQQFTATDSHKEYQAMIPLRRA
ncbi:MAG: tetratricopeptide repeat protein, partial [Pirellulaceae bacterium]|nr:tetratricopeptide repeat protein [Pirellulaceae bacterium]